MTGRIRLSWVTALTVASLLLGGGTLNALADGHGGNNKGHGSGSGKVEHREQTAQRPAEVRHDDQSARGPTTTAGTTGGALTTIATTTIWSRPRRG